MTNGRERPLASSEAPLVYEAPGDAALPRGRLLLLSPHFPPGTAAGALRWEKLAAMAVERGFGVDVITLDPASLGAPDVRRLAALPAGLRVFGVPAIRLPVERAEDLVWRVYRRLRPRGVEPARGPEPEPQAQRKGSFGRAELRFDPTDPRAWQRAYNAWLDHARGAAWARRAEALALERFAPGTHRAVVTCGPPQMVCRAGWRLARARGVPFVMDMRDPWSLVERLPESIASPVWLRLARRHEAAAVARATLVTCATEPFRDAMRRRHPEDAERILAVLNGYDEEPPAPLPRDPRFLVAYAGSVYLDRSPVVLFRAAARVVHDLGLGPERFGFELMGAVETFDGVPLETLAREQGLAGYVRTHPPRPRGEAMEFLARASLLVSLPQDSHLAIPSKVFEYMRFEAWLLALAERASATARVLEGTRADVVEPDDVDGMAAVLRRRFEEHAKGVRPPRIPVGDRLSRRAQASRLFDALERRLG